MELDRRRPREYRERINFLLSECNFKERFRFSYHEVEELLQDIGPHLTNCKDFAYGLQPHHRLLLALRFYATGDFCYSVGDCHGISKSSVHSCVKKVTEVLNEVYFSEVVSWPSSENDRNRIASEFYGLCRFPAVCGAIDGTLINIMSPSENEFQFVDRKGSHSLNVMAIAGPDYRFYGINANWPGCLHDARVLRESMIFRRFSEGWRPFPNAVILGDSAYPLLPWLMTAVLKPENQLSNAKKRYNHALRRTRFCVENAFGILKSRFQCLKFVRVQNPQKASLIINVCAILHNILISARKNSDYISSSEEVYDEQMQHSTDQLFEASVSNQERRAAISRRNTIVATFNV